MHHLQFNVAVRAQTIGVNMTLLQIVYYVQGAALGELVVESAFISSAAADTRGMRERTTVVIGE